MALYPFEQHRPALGPGVYVADSAEIIGDVSIGADSSVWPRAVVRGDIQRIRIGAGSNIQDGSILHVTHDSQYCPGGQALHLGSGVTVGHGVILHGCTVEDGCLIGMGALVMDGAHLEAGLILAAGSLVSPGKRLTGGMLWRGRPAQCIRPLTAAEQDYLGYVAQHYCKLKDRYLAAK